MTRSGAHGARGKPRRAGARPVGARRQGARDDAPRDAGDQDRSRLGGGRARSSSRCCAASPTRLAGHRVVVELPADLPLVRVDAPLIEQALANLVENAAIHTPPGTLVRVRAQCQRRRDDRVGRGLRRRPRRGGPRAAVREVPARVRRRHRPRRRPRPRDLPRDRPAARRPRLGRAASPPAARRSASRCRSTPRPARRPKRCA